ncbi:hypothetical protein [Candidatus Villigracilis saccharophilus]|uniref:hypothetical protein n=1 Tax=Candidatus Villigracilis saccharophilus TaxID=3140684 RepID=UPI0031372473|nr:hypothetical protein [Anaerolineales bacterium]
MKKKNHPHGNPFRSDWLCYLGSLFTPTALMTQVNLERTASERRQESLTRQPALSQSPDLVTYDKQEAIVNAPLHVPAHSW